MDNKIVRLERRANPEGTKTWLAEVVEVEDGEATNIFLPEINREVNVFAHSSSVTVLDVGDTVLVQNVQSHFIVTHRLRRKGEKPQKGFSIKEDGRLEVDSDDGIVIRSNQSRLEIRKDGRIFIDGKEIYAIADGKHRLQGATIELN
ncbi:MAG: hypothetical protein PVG20_04995 [Thioalkalispiraceae bacterium]|jgi:hypothetical protein